MAELVPIRANLTLRVPDAVQREALAERCTADPGPPNSEFVAIPGLQRSVTLRVTLRCARETPLKLAPMGVVPAIHILTIARKKVDARDKPAHDVNANEWRLL
jgi:hypothetical protein